MRLILVPLLFGCLISLAQTKEYVCPPCNLPCDNVVHTKPGTCQSCHMTLVAKASVRYEDLSAEEFCERIASNPNAVLLDVRSKGEFDGSRRNTYGHFKNAININITELEQRIGELEQYKDREILVYCSQSIRSPRAAIILTEHGFNRVANLSGGVSRMDARGSDCLVERFVVH